jgi:hypothetical protein
MEKWNEARVENHTDAPNHRGPYAATLHRIETGLTKNVRLTAHQCARREIWQLPRQTDAVCQSATAGGASFNFRGF